MNKSHSRLGAILLGLAACALAGCEAAPPPGTPLSVLVRNQSYQVNAEMPGTVRTGTPTTIRLHVSRKGKPSDLAGEYRVLHAVLASEDGNDVAHTASLRGGDGTYELTHDFPRPGRYRLWVEVDDTKNPERHGAHADLIAYADLEATGKPSRGALPVRANESASGGVILHLTGSELRPGVAAGLRLWISDASGATLPLPSTDGAEYVLVGDGLRVFRHGPLATATDGKSALLSLTVERPGDYVLWLESDPIDGKNGQTVHGAFALTVGEPVDAITRR